MASPPPPFPPGQGPPQGMPMPPPGQRPTPEQIQQIQRRIAEDAQKAGMTVPDFIEHIRKQAMEQQRLRAQQQGGQPQQPGAPGAHPHPHPHPNQPPGSVNRQVPLGAPGVADPKALAVAKFLKGQDLKPRTCILNGERKDMFKGTLHRQIPLIF